jgi:hypothetical protein
MTAPNVRIDVSGAVARLSEVMKAAHDLSPVFAGPINQSLNEVFIKQFQTEGAYGGKKWAPLAPVTRKLRQRRGHGRGGILRDTNKLWASFTKLGLGPDAVKIVRPDSLTRGSTVIYAEPHQTGFTSRTFVVINKLGNPVALRRKVPKKIPARPIIPETMPSTVVQSWEKMIADFIAR